jgi:hypothetical protein
LPCRVYRSAYFKKLCSFGLLFSLCQNLLAQETKKMYLSGTGSNDTKQWQFYCSSGMNSGKWTSIPVPSCWELQGFGKYNYGLDKDSLKGKEQGLYKYSFKIPSSWRSKDVDLVFEGVMTDAEVKVNGHSAGELHQGAFYAFHYDISQILNYGGTNLLEVTVSKHSSNPSVNAAERKGDFWIFGGIFRPVYLEVLPKQHIGNVAIDAKANGRFKVEVEQFGGDRLGIKLLDDKKRQSGKEIFAPTKGKITLVEGNFRTPKLWSPEFPNLYTAVFTLYKKGKAVHVHRQKFGFRTVEVRQRDGIYVNGVKVKMKGVNRHSFYPTTGRTTSKELSIEDILLMKDMNMNAVRMSHYPPDEHFLDACDSLGMFVLDELAGWHGNYNTLTGSKLVKEMVVHDVNHPSIILWANGNEGGHNIGLDPLFARYDIEKRTVVHPWQLFNGIDAQHYREFNYGIGNYDLGHNIVMPTEFLHGWFDGGHAAGLEDYWEKMWHDPLNAGGFLWDFADEGVVRKDKNDSIDTDKFHGADGIMGPFHEKEASYYGIKEIWSPVHFETRQITKNFDGYFYIENRYHYTNLSQCSFRWKLKRLTEKRDSLDALIAAPDIKAGQRGTLKVTLPQNWTKYDVLYITAYGPDKKELFTWSFPIELPLTISQRFMQESNRSTKLKATISQHDSLYSIVGNNIKFSINRNNGHISEIVNSHGTIPLNNGPVVQEAINNFSSFNYHYTGDTLIVESTYDRKKNYNTLRWEVFPSGVIKLQVNYFPAEYYTWFDGINFSFPEKEIKSVRYLGFGPYRVWKNRLKGNSFGVWTKPYNNTETAESWIYPEFKGYHSNMYWCRFITTSQPFTVYTENEDLYLRLFTPAFKTDQWHNYEPLFPTGDISFMQGISSIGTKSQRAETTGPMGMKNIFYDYEKDPSRALHIVLYFDFRPAYTINQ